MEFLPLDHLVYAVPDLAAGVERLEARLGVAAMPGGSHPGWGTANALFPLGGETYLEVIGPDPSQPEPPQCRPFGLDAVQEPGLVAWAVKAAGIEGVCARARRRGYDPGPVREMRRRRPDGVELSWRLALPPRWPASRGGLVPFLIDWGGTPHPAPRGPAPLALVELRGRHPEPEGVRAALAALGVSLAVSRAPAAELEAVVSGPRGEVSLGGADGSPPPTDR